MSPNFGNAARYAALEGRRRRGDPLLPPVPRDRGGGARGGSRCAVAQQRRRGDPGRAGTVPGDREADPEETGRGKAHEAGDVPPSPDGSVTTIRADRTTDIARARPTTKRVRRAGRSDVQASPRPNVSRRGADGAAERVAPRKAARTMSRGIRRRAFDTGGPSRRTRRATIPILGGDRAIGQRRGVGQFGLWIECRGEVPGVARTARRPGARPVRTRGPAPSEANPPRRAKPIPGAERSQSRAPTEQPIPGRVAPTP